MSELFYKMQAEKLTPVEPDPPCEQNLFVLIAWNIDEKRWAICRHTKRDDHKTMEDAVAAAKSLSMYWSHATIVEVQLPVAHGGK